MRDRTDRILIECGALVDDVAQNLAEKGQGPAVPSDPEEESEEDPKEDPEEDPEKDPVAPMESVGSAST